MPVSFGRLRERLKNTASATTLTVLAEVVPEDERWFVERVCVRGNTTTGADCLLSVVVAGYKHALYYFKDLVVTEWAAVDLDLWLFKGESLAFEWSGIVSGEIVEGHVTGSRRWV